MEQFYKDFGFIIGFMFLALLVLMAFGEKVERGFLLTVLFSMAILNASTVTNFMDKTFKLSDDEEEKK